MEAGDEGRRRMIGQWPVANGIEQFAEEDKNS